MVKGKYEMRVAHGDGACQITIVRHLGAAAVVVFADYLLVLTDSIIAGRVIGESALGAMNLLVPVFSATTFFTWLLASGVSTLYQLSLRKRDERRSAEIAGQGLTTSILLAIVICAAIFCFKRAYLSFMGPSGEITSYACQYLSWYPATVAFQSVGMLLLYLVFVRGGQLVCIKAYAVQLIANVALSYELSEAFGMAGISFGTAASYLIWFGALGVLLRIDESRPRFVRARLDPFLLFRSIRSAFGESFAWMFHAILFFGIAKYVLCFWDSESLSVCAVVFFIIRLTVFFGGVSVALRPLETALRTEAADSSEITRVFRIGTVATLAAMAFSAAIFVIAPEPVIGLFGIATADLVDGAKFAARITVVGLVLGGLAAFLPLAWRMRKSQCPEARLNYLQSYVLSRISTEPSSQMFNLAKLFRLRRGIDLERLSSALTAAGEAHGALRTVIRRDATGEFVQRQELAFGAVRCPVVKMSESDLLANRPTLVKSFKLNGGTLFDAKIFDCGDGRAYLLSNFHHLICDGYSFPLILADAHRAWNGETLEPDAYYEVLAQREERAARPVAVAGRNFMREILKDRDFTTLPPADFHGTPGYGGIEVMIPLPKDFDDILATRRATRHHFFLAASAIALRRISEASDVLLDWVFHGRISKDELKTVGAFMVDLPLVFDGTEDMTASDVIALVKRATFNGIKNVNFFRDVTDCNPTGQDRLTFIYQDAWGELMSPGPVREDGPYAWMIEETIPLSAPQAATENPFNVEIMEHRDETRLFIEYDTGRYAESTARRYADLFKEALDWLICTPAELPSQIRSQQRA